MNDLIQFQKERISALEAEVKRLNDELKETKETLYRTAHKIRVSDPVFLKPIQIIDYDTSR